MAIALVGSLLLLISTYLPHHVIPGQKFGSFTLWDVLKATNQSSLTTGSAVAFVIGAYLVYFVITGVRRVRHPLTHRVWAATTILIAALVVLHVTQRSLELESEIFDLRRGTGFALMILAGMVMILGSVVGVIGPQRTAASPPSQKIKGPTSREPTRDDPASHPDIAARLRQLKSLLDDSLITIDEYESRRSKILDDL